MKLLFKLAFISFILLSIISSCTDQVTYAEQLKDEKNLIADFISRNNYTVVETKPTTIPYPTNVYYKTSTGLYINITNAGDTSSDSLEVNDLVVFRYMQYTLDAKADTSSYMNTVDNPFPVTFNYYDLTQEQSCKGWHEAVSFMKYNNAEAKIIVYSKLSFSDQSAVVPYGYDIRVKIRK